MVEQIVYKSYVKVLQSHTSIPTEHNMVGTVTTPNDMISIGAPKGVKEPIVFSINVSTCRPVTESMIELSVLAHAAKPAVNADIHHHPIRKAGNSPAKKSTWFIRWFVFFHLICGILNAMKSLE